VYKIFNLATGDTITHSDAKWFSPNSDVGYNTDPPLQSAICWQYYRP
jgi:hypothetical protein